MCYMVELLARLTRPRHLMVAAVVFLLSGGLGWTAVGLARAQGGSEQATAAPPGDAAPIAIPLPMQGDRGRYELQMESGPADQSLSHGGFATGQTQPLTFNWGQDAFMRNRTGVLHRTNTFSTSEFRQDRWDNRTYILYAGSDRLLAIDAVHTESTTPPGPSTLPILPQPTSAQNLTYLFTQYTDGDGSASGACGVRHWLQGMKIRLDGPAIAGGAGCSLLRTHEKDVRLWVEGVREGPEGREVKLRVQSLSIDLPYGWLWFREGLAYPLRIELPATQDGSPVLWVWSLTALDRGTEPILATNDAKGESAPPLVLADRKPWGPDDSGVEVPFPLSLAYAKARDNPNYPTMREFLSKHPDAYVAWARNGAVTWNPGDRQDTWSILLTNGHESLAVDSTRIETASPVGGIASPFGPSVTFSASDGDPDPPFGDEANYLMPNEVPERLPTVASLLERWKYYRTDTYAAEKANSWSFFFARDLDGPGGTPGLYLAAGHKMWTRDAGPTYPVTQDYTDRFHSSEIASYESLDGVDRLDEVRDAHTTWQVGPKTPVQAPAQGAEAEPRPLTLSANAFFAFGPAETTTLGLGALAVSLLYWLWPAAKSGLLLLFSRLRGNELLENPIRARLMARIEAEPGVHHKELVRLAGKGNGTVEHHVDRLVNAGLVVRHRGTGFTCYFARSAADRRAMLAAPLLKSPIARAVMVAVQTEHGVTSSQLASRLGVTAPTIHYHVARLRNASLIETHRQGNVLHLAPTPLARIPMNQPLKNLPPLPATRE
jgi:DNA-binding MarR family transcriptional regulator